MANYNLVVNSTFQPFSYERYIKPYEEYEKAYLAQEALNDALSEASSKWEEQIDETVDRELYDRVVQYNADLKKQAEDLSKYGLSPNRRKDLMALKRRYDRDIDPINTAFTRREALAKEQREGLRVNDSLLYDTDFGTVSLQYMMDNPNATYATLNGNSITERTAAMAKEAAAAMVSDPEFTSVYNGQYVQQKIQQGYTMEQVLAAAANDPNAPEALTNIIKAIKSQVGYDKWKGDKSRIDHYIKEGLYAAVMNPQISIIADRSYLTPQERTTIALQQSNLRAQAAQLDAQTNGTPTPDGGRIIKLGGNYWIRYDKDGNVVDQNVPLTPEEKETQKVEQELSEALIKVSDTSDLKPLGYVPIGAVIKTGSTGWRSGVEGQDIGESESENLPEGVDPIEEDGEFLGFNNSNLSTAWGNFTYSPPKGTEVSVVTTPESIPGYKAAAAGSDPFSEIESNTAFGKILRMLDKKGISYAEAFGSNNVVILQVKGQRKRARSSEPYDYIIYRRP